MKRQFYLVLLILFSSFFVRAQDKQPMVPKGQVYLGGNLSYSHFGYNTGTNSQTNYNIAPVTGKAVRDNTLVGISLGYSRTKAGTPASVYDAYGLGVFLRQYKPLGKGFAAFLQGDLSGGLTRETTYPDYNDPAWKGKGYALTASLDAGIAYAITKKVQLETGFNGLISTSFAHSSNKSTDPSVTGEGKTNTYSIGTSVDKLFRDIVIGFRIFI